MSATFTDQSLESPGIDNVIPEIQRTPFYLKSQGGNLFSCLHVRSDESVLNHGVILCSPLGFEQLHASRSLRHLADAIAGIGFPVLRFDWHGTGDSDGTDHDQNRLEIWQANLRDAILWMKTSGDCRQISLAGLRMGATIAGLVAEDVEIENLVLWTPVTRGRTYVREMQAIDLTGEARNQRTQNPPGIEAGGFLLTKSTADDLSGIDLSESHPRCKRMLIVHRAELPSDRRLSEAILSKGIPLEELSLAGYPEMMAEPHRSQVPEQIIEGISAWLQPSHPETDLFPVFRVSESPANLETPSYTERPIRISEDPDLFGILTRPQKPEVAERPTLLLLNAGATSHVGPGRLNIHLAREFAIAGFQSLRLDFQGLGESIASGSVRENDSYSSAAFRDIQITIRRLRKDFGVKRSVLLGLCSGAYAAFQSAARIPDSEIVESIIINPLTFYWREGMTIDDDPVRHLVRQHYYREILWDPHKWIKFLSGRSKTGFMEAARVVARKIELTLSTYQSSRKKKRASVVSCDSVSPLGHPQVQDLTGDLQQIARSRRHLSMFFSESDPGYAILNHFARKQARILHRSGQLDLGFIPDADHTFSREAARKSLIESLIAHLQRRYP